MESDVIVQLLGSVVLAAIAGAIINGIINRRKLGAEATEIITKAASGVVERLEAELVRERADRRADRDTWREERAEMIERIGDLETSEYISRQTLQLHAAWDHMAVTALANAGITDLPQPPPLYPPPHSRSGPREG